TARPAERAIALDRRRPEAGAASDHDRARGIGHRERPDQHAIRGRSGRRAETALEVGGGGAEAGANAAEIEARRSCCRGRIAELAIRGKAPPVFVATSQQIEQGGAWHDGYPGGADCEPAALFAQARLHAPAGVEPERRAAGER